MRSPFIFTSLALALVAPSLPADARARASDLVVFNGMCDASGAVSLDPATFAVANDEDNVLRIYDVRRGGPPLRTVDLSPALPLDQRGKPDGDPQKAGKKEGKKHGKKPRKSPEADLEAATTLGDTAYWLTSHGLNSKGKRKDARFIFFATSLPRPDGPATMVGRPYQSLHDDLLQAPELARFDLRSASERAPKEPGGLNLEGLTAAPDGQSLYIGFRNPVPQGKALLVPLLNPAEVMRGQRARFGQPRQLDLGGQGIRALSWWRGHYLIIAGDHGDGGTSHLYRWDGRGEARRLPGIDFQGLNPEAFFTPESEDEILVFSDDGGVTVDGRRCKDLEDERQRQFRGLRLRL